MSAAAPLAEHPQPRGAHLILVGLPGAGKTTVGQLVAERLGSPFVDLDAEIERMEGRSIEAIFAEHGEARFRELELRSTEAVANRGNLVLAPGGGWVTQPGLLALLRPPGRIIHLDVTPATALARMGSTVRARPLLATAEPLAVLERLLEARGPAYAAADAVLDTETLDLQELVAQLAALAAAWGAGVG